MSDSQFETLLAEQAHVVRGVLYGQNQSFTWARGNILLLPQIMYPASDPKNIHYSQTKGLVDELAFARGLLSEASAFMRIWPRTQTTMDWTIREWTNSHAGNPSIPSRLLLPAIPEFVATANLLRLDGPEARQTKRDVYQRWWGLHSTARYEAEYEAAGKLPTTPYVDRYDTFSGYGRGDQFYPSATQSMIVRESDLLKVQMVDGSKKGRITSVYGVDGHKVTKPSHSPYEVDVTWEGGSSERLSYFAVRQLDPILGKPLICRAQLLMSPYDADGKPMDIDEAKNSFVKQLASVLAIASLDSGEYATLLPAQIVKAWANISHDFLVPGGVNKRYQNITESQGGKTLRGWQTTQGQQIMEDIFMALHQSVMEIARLGPKIGEFLDDYDVVGLGTVHDSGLVVCPACHNCEPLNIAECVDFGIQTDDTDGFSSVIWQTVVMPQGDSVQCVATVKCANCQTLYYRKFNTLIRVFDNIISRAKVEANPDPDFRIDNSEADGGCEDASVSAYTFLPRSETGSRGLTSLPRLRLFAEFEGRIKAADIALEAGTQSRNLKKKNCCSGEYLTIAGASHAYFDQYIGKNGLRGTGDFAMSNCSDFTPSRFTNALICSWCEQVSLHLNEPVATTLEPATYYEGEINFLQIESESGSTKFNKRDMADEKGGDYIATGGELKSFWDEDGNEQQYYTDEVIQYYRLRLIQGSKTRILEVRPHQVGIAIPEVDESPSTDLSIAKTPPCPNENERFLTPTFAFFDKYLKAEQAHEGQESRFMVCEQLAYSARKNPETNTWEVKTPPRSLIEDRGPGGYDEFKALSGADASGLVWTDGNPECVTPNGQRERFPNPRLGRGSAATLITPYASNQQKRTIPQYHDLKVVGKDIENGVSEVTGEKFTITTPYLHCLQCDNSYHGAPTEDTGRKWKLPNSVGTEFLRPGEEERRNDSRGGYGESSLWHWTLPLYTEKQFYEIWIDNLAAKTPGKLKEIFPSKMVNWILAGQTFPTKEVELNA